MEVTLTWHWLVVEVSVTGVGSRVDGRYEMVTAWANGRGVYRRAGEIRQL